MVESCSEQRQDRHQRNAAADFVSVAPMSFKFQPKKEINFRKLNTTIIWFRISANHGLTDGI